MKILLILAAFVLVSPDLSSEGKETNNTEAIEICNEYIDNLLSKVMEKHGNMLDPFYTHWTLVNFFKNVESSKSVGFNGEVIFTNGSIEGLKNIRRISPCSISHNNERYKLSAHLQSSGPLFNAEAFVIYIKNESTVNMNGNCSTVDVDISLSLNARTANDLLLEELRVVDIKDLDFSIEGLTLSSLHGVVTELATNYFRNSTNKVFWRMGNFMQDEISNNPLAIRELGIDEDNPKFVKIDADRYIENVLKTSFVSEADYAKLDPYTLQNDHIEKDFLKISEIQDSIKTKLKVTNGYLDNLSRAKRIQDCSKPIWRPSNVTFTCYIGFDKLQIKYETGDNSKTSDLELIGTITNTMLKVQIQSNTKDYVPFLKNIDVIKVGKVSVKAASAIAESTYQNTPDFDKDLLAKHFSNTLVNVLKGRFKEVLAYSIFRTPF